MTHECLTCGGHEDVEVTMAEIERLRTALTSARRFVADELDLRLGTDAEYQVPAGVALKEIDAALAIQTANARLIVAAPELLAVCQAFIERLGPNGYYPTAGGPLTNKMRQAIALATQD